jgi:hypothetical protein
MKGRREFIAGLGSAAALPGEFIGGLAALGAAGTSPVLWPHAALAQLRPVVGYLSPGAQANEAERLTVLRDRSSPPLSGASVLSASRLESLAPFPLASPARFSRSIQEPDCRPRRALLHLSYSCATPCGPAMLVTQDPNRK